jgi:hypothetical protein
MSKPKVRFVEWKNSFCTLRFKTSQPAGEPFDLGQILRIREPITRSQRTFRGKVHDEAHGKSHHGESHNEVKGLVILVVCAHADTIAVQPFRLSYKFEGKSRRYTPDVLIVWGGEIWVVEIKDDKKAEAPHEKARYELVGSLLATHRIHFLVWKKSKICAEPRLSTARNVIRYQKCCVTAFERERIRLMFTATPVVALGDLNDDDIRSVLRLVIEGTLHIDWSSRLSRTSWVSASPIGQQLWPSTRALAAAGEAAL